MKKKSLFKRLSSVALAFLLSLSALTQGITASAFSDKNQATQQWLSTWSYDFRGSGLPNGYDIETGKYNDTHFTGYFASEVPYFTTSDNNYAYCINFDKLHNSGTVSKQQTLNDYMKKGHIPDDMQYQIKEFCIYSYKGKTQYGYSKDIELCASSVMSQAVSARFFDESTTGLSSNETKLLNSYYYNGNNASAHHQELVECYKKMKSEMLSHYDIPKGTSKKHDMIGKNATYPAKYDVKTGKWTATVKLDSTLSQFSISKPNAVTSQKSGSQVILTADNEKDLKNTVITITKTKGKYVEHIDECSPLILSGGSDVQEMVVSCYEDKDPVKAYLKVQISTGSAELDKTFTDFFGNAQTATDELKKAVKFNLVYTDGGSDKYVKATGSNGKYTFSSTVAQANATDMTLDADGNIHVSGLPQGSYYWKETTTANGYALKTKTDVTVEADKTSKTVVDNQRTSVDKGELVIYKTDESGKKYLSGAKFEITAAEDIVVSGGITIRKKGDIIDTVTTDENGKAVITKDIYQGYSYTVTEIEAPKGYSLNSEPQTVKIATDTADFGSEVSVKNSPWTAPFIITKKNLGGELLPNCEFEILDENKRQITTGITDENGVATFSLGYGKYFYHEIAAPEEYIIDDTLYPFEITEEGVSVYAKMTNYLKEGSIKVTKSTTGNLNIKDIRFVVKGISDTNSDIERELFTDENGEALFENLPIGKYTVTEDGSTVPAAYLVANEQTVTVEYNTTAEVKVTNEEKTGSIKVQKRTEGQKNVEGITFYLKGTSDSGREINIPATTDKDGIAVFENVPVGTYMVIEDEETVPYGYLVADEKKVTVIYSETVDAEIINNEQTGTIKVHKRTEGDLNISGITFYLKGTSDTGREINIPAETDKDGIAKFENVPIGTYKVIEDEKTVPYGYLVAAEKEVTVTYAETVDTDILNAEQTGTIQVHKKTADMTNVEGIRFILSGVSDTGREINIPAITDKDGIAKFENVPIGTYTITEDGSTVPYGYLVADSKQVTVAYAQTVDTDMVNEKAPDTPNTGVMDNDSDGRTALCSVAIILAGAAVLMFSRKKKER
ncbi:SpaA isopeptide-forming pilin-related protein [Ruminococcus bicirculans (ex Wegman et al. 2014)]|jgi:Predicted outer membrane protein|uniref:SpaA isopeptide-forming pilin-related protein n=1 Tax=Ruminococcus bicirculans (ex Wegman et al. 2014) TaxID=1160721 RepID=UPI0039A2718C